MSLVFMDGFEAQDMSRYTVTSVNAVAYITGRFGTGTAFEGSGNSGGTLLSRAIPATAKAVVGMAVKRNTSASDSDFLVFRADGGSTSHVTVRFGTSGAISITRGGTTLASASGVDSSQWHYIEASATINGSTGRVTVRVDGAVVIDFTGNTKNGGTSTNIDTIQFGSPGGTNTQRYWIDDVYIMTGTDSGVAGLPNNDFIGDVRVQSLVPTGPGSNTNLTPSTGANWAAVDELPPSATDYVSGATVGLRDTYATSDLPAGYSIFGVQVSANAKKTDAGVRSLKTVIRSGGTDYSDASGTVLGTADSTVSVVRETNPSGSAIWTQAAVNAMEIGVEVA